jgi:DNA transformation protein
MKRPRQEGPIMADSGDSGFFEFVLDQLRALPAVRHRRMFGAWGLYHEDAFFGIVDDGRLYFLTDESTRPEYEAKGMKAFQPSADQTLKNYIEVPVDVLEDDTELCRWARTAAGVQRRKKGKRGKRPR